MTMRPHRQVEVVLLMKSVHPLVIAKDIDRIKYIISWCYFLVMSFYYYYYSCNIILANYHVDFNVILDICFFILILDKYDLKSLICR